MPESQGTHSGAMRDVLAARRDEVMEIAARYGASNLRVFGSVARGEDRADSDLDLLIDLEPGRSLLDLAGLMLDLEALLGRRVDVGEADCVKPRYRDRILAEAVPLQCLVTREDWGACPVCEIRDRHHFPPSRLPERGLARENGCQWGC